MVTQAEYLMLTTIALIYESLVIALFSSVLFLGLKKYQQKKHKLTFYLILILVNFTVAVIFSWISKLLVLTIRLDFNHVPENFINEYDETIPLFWFLYRITDFRVSFVFVTLAIYFSYVLKVNLFEKGYKKIQRIFVIVYSIFTAVFAFFMYTRSNKELGDLLDMLAFFFLFLLMFLIYIPFFLRTFKAYRNVNDPVFKRGFLALAFMSISFVLVLFCFLIDRLMLLNVPGYEVGFTVFYYLAWLFCVLGAILGYVGYIKPRTAT
ncbi:MAG: hypothetical protein ACFFBP_04635 [Promethearchaeota archaeon]